MGTPTSSNGPVTWTSRFPPRLAPRPLAAAVAMEIRANPAKHLQDYWWWGDYPSTRGGGIVMTDVSVLRQHLLDRDCDTTGCVAGYTIALGAPDGTRYAINLENDTGIRDVADEFMVLPGSYDPSVEGLAITETISDMAAALLGLPELEPWRVHTHWLFRTERTFGEVLHALDRIAAGRSIADLCLEQPQNG